MAEAASKPKSNSSGGGKGGGLVNRGIMAGLLGGILWLAVMAGFDLYTKGAIKHALHTPKAMVVLLGVTKDPLGVGLPYALGVAATLLLFIVLGVLFAFLSAMIPLEVSVVLGFLFGGAVMYFLFFLGFDRLSDNPTDKLNNVALTVACLAAGVTFGLKMHK